MLQRQLLDRRSLQFQTASGRAIGLRQYQDDLETRLGDGFERDTRELGRTRENDAQAAHEGSRSNSRSSPVWYRATTPWGSM